ncbi:MAG: hypothetical protein ACTHOF_08020, partial [Flavisolibacter sp.]
KETSPKRITGSFGQRLPVDQKNLTYAFYDGSFLISFSAYASLFYDVFFFYHKASSLLFLLIK